MTTESNDVPRFENVRVGDRFDYIGNPREVVRIQDHRIITSGGYWNVLGWRMLINNGDITNYRRASDPTPIGELIAEKFATMERDQIQHPGYASKRDWDGQPFTEGAIERLTDLNNEDYAERQERHKRDILRSMREQWFPNANGLCVMQGRRR